MNTSRIMDEAHRWSARLASPDCSAAERQSFERWRTESAHAQAFADTERLCHAVRRLAHEPEAQQLIGRILEDHPLPQQRSRRRLGFALAASLALCLIGGALYLGLGHYVSTDIYTTQSGQRSTIQLADGSQLILNASTKIAVELGRDRRHFTLQRGEALFVVADDPVRPFTVLAGDSEVTALGTRFTVRNEHKQVIVTLLEGRIAVDRREIEQHLQLDPGEQLRFEAAASAVARRTVDPALAASWTAGKLKFRSTPLAEVMEEVNRYSRTQIRLEDAALAEKPVNGIVELNDPDSIAAALQTMLPDVELQARGDTLVILTRR